MIDFITTFGIPQKYAGDVWVFFVFLVLGVAILFLFNKKNIVALIFSVYVGYSLAMVAASFEVIEKNPQLKTAFFLLATLVVFSICKSFVHFGIGGKPFFVWLKSILLSLSVLGFGTAVVLNWFPRKELEKSFTSLSLEIFRSQEAFLVWAALPLIIIFIIKRPRY